MHTQNEKLVNVSNNIHPLSVLSDDITRIRLNGKSQYYQLLRYVYCILYLLPIYGLYGYFVITDMTSSTIESSYYAHAGLYIFFGIIPFIITLSGDYMYSKDIVYLQNKVVRNSNFNILGIPFGTFTETIEYVRGSQNIVYTKFTSSCESIDTMLINQWKYDIIASFIIIVNIIIKIILPLCGVENKIISYYVDNGFVTIYASFMIPVLVVVIFILLCFIGCYLACMEWLCCCKKNSVGKKRELINGIDSSSELEINQIA